MPECCPRGQDDRSEECVLLVYRTCQMRPLCSLSLQYYSGWNIVSENMNNAQARGGEEGLLPFCLAREETKPGNEGTEAARV